MYEIDETGEEFENELKHVIEKQPYEIDAYSLLSEFYTDKGEYWLAHLYCDRGMQIMKTIALQERKGLIYLEQENYQSAFQQFSKIKEEDPEHPEINLLIGDTHFAEFNLAEAKESYQKQIDLQEDDDEAHIKLGNVLAKEEEFDLAID